MHFKIEKDGQTNGVKVRLEPRTEDQNVRTWPDLTTLSSEMKENCKLVERYYGMLFKHVDGTIAKTWHGDPTPYLIEAIKGKAIMMPQASRDRLVAAQKAIREALKNQCPLFKLDVPSVLKDKKVVAYINQARGNEKTAHKILENSRQWRGNKQDISNTTLKDSQLPEWWMGRSVSTGYKWHAPIVALSKVAEANQVTAAIGCVSDHDKWSRCLAMLPLVQKFDARPSANVTEFNILSQLPLPTCQYILSDVYLPPDTTKGMTQTAAKCNAQDLTLTRLTQIAVEAGAQVLMVKCFPRIDDDVVHMRHLETHIAFMRQNGYEHFGFFPGGRGHNMEIIVCFSKLVLDNTINLTYIEKQFPIKGVCDRLAKAVSVLSCNANFRRNGMLHYGILVSSLPTNIAVIPSGPPVVSRNLSNQYQLMANWKFEDKNLDTIEGASWMFDVDTDPRTAHLVLEPDPPTTEGRASAPPTSTAPYGKKAGKKKGRIKTYKQKS
jgi:hypothetical protein